jgi:hypothetical protein
MTQRSFDQLSYPESPFTRGTVRNPVDLGLIKCTYPVRSRHYARISSRITTVIHVERKYPIDCN